MTLVLPTLGFNFALNQLVLDFDGELEHKARECGHWLLEDGYSFAIVRRSERSFHLVSDFPANREIHQKVAFLFGADETAVTLWASRGYSTLRVSEREGERPVVIACSIVNPRESFHAKARWAKLVQWLALVGAETPAGFSAYMQPKRAPTLGDDDNISEAGR